MNVNAQTIELYAKQLRTPTFNRYEDVLRQLGPDRGYEDFLIALMKMELDSRMESSQRRKIRTAGFPYIKTMDELDFSRFEHINEAFIRELASCDFVSKRQNIVMIGNPGTGNYRKYLVMERFSTNSRQSYGQCPKSFHNIDVI